MKSKKVLLAEDNEMMRFMLSEMLEELEYDFDVCRDGQECLTMLNDAPNDYAIVLMDIHMPFKSGLDAVSEIRNSNLHPPKGIPVIAVTADQHWQHLERCIKIGFNDVMPKPVSMNRLSEGIKTHLVA
ncbi:response regulator [Parasulfitobacter algicola]|uniref:Response regulator n=1 Tax=Parasulfitobacter algicola TaxID=2614809 RepID=A0ABX2IUV6_9RHOB|nr:response regulator [Sulfitobacter algicola]NSX54622.1 response regulator [Sulfitobacter algicola]